MDKYYIRGGRALNGELQITAAKNSYLPILAGSILCDGQVILHNYPAYLDTINMTQILTHLGARATLSGEALILDMTPVNKYEIDASLTSLTRSSFFTLGAMLGRFKKAKIAYPGGCEIGSRPIDLHLKGLRALNVKITDKYGYITCDGKNMRGGEIHLDFPSVGATENLIMAAATTRGVTKIINAAKEPEIVDLQNFLNSAGAKIRGAGTSVIIIDGVKKLSGVEFTPITDRIITGTYLIACAICGGNIRLKTQNAPHLTALINKLSTATCKICADKHQIEMQCTGRFPAIRKIETMPYPAFPTDLQSQMVALLATANGTSVIVENLFETRYKFASELAKMGADIVIKDRLAIITGKKRLFGAEVVATDLRGGAALVLAGLMADGCTTVSNVSHIQRGYATMDNDLAALGADISVACNARCARCAMLAQVNSEQ